MSPLHGAMYNASKQLLAKGGEGVRIATPSEDIWDAVDNLC
jgi:hypothetical protein